MPCLQFFNVTNMSFNAISRNFPNLQQFSVETARFVENTSSVHSDSMASSGILQLIIYVFTGLII